MYELAILDFNKAISIDPLFAYPFNNRGYAYLKLGNRAQAIQDINHSLTLDPDNSYAYKNRALYYLELNDLVNAKQNLLTAQQLGFRERYGDEVDKLLQRI